MVDVAPGRWYSHGSYSSRGGDVVGRWYLDDILILHDVTMTILQW